MNEKARKIILLNKRLLEYKKYKNKPQRRKLRIIIAILYVFCMLFFSTITTELSAYFLGTIITISGISADIYITEQIKKQKEKLEEEIFELNAEIYQESLRLEKSSLATNNIYYKVGEKEYTHGEITEMSNVSIPENPIQLENSQRILKK